MSGELDALQIRADAERLLDQHGADPLALVVSLLYEVRRDFQQREAIREGYEHDARLQRWLHECALADQIQNIANAIRREVGKPPFSHNAHLTYDGGLRRAYRITEGVAAGFRMGIVPLDHEVVSS